MWCEGEGEIMPAVAAGCLLVSQLRGRVVGLSFFRPIRRRAVFRAGEAGMTCHDHDSGPADAAAVR